jgi:hypothetical protein
MRFYMRGSARDRTLEGGGVGLETYVHVESDEPPERIRDLVRMGEQTCFTLGALTDPLPVETRVTLNGEELALESEAE